ncbi:MAG TPA: hypothetical protein VGC06_15350 [Actinomycetes bacterium]
MTWPPIPDKRAAQDIDLLKIRYQGEVDEAKAQLRDQAAAEGRNVDEDWELEKYNWEQEKAAMAAEYALQKSIHDARIEIAKGSIERAHKGAEFIRNAASAIATVYTGVAGLAFASKDGLKLPTRRVIPAIFLGLALVLSAAYVAWIRRGPDSSAPTPTSSLPEYQDRRINAFTTWVSRIALNRAYTMHAAVISLGAGVLFLPMPFIELPTWFVWGAPICVLILMLVIPYWTAGYWSQRKRR